MAVKVGALLDELRAAKVDAATWRLAASLALRGAASAPIQIGVDELRAYAQVDGRALERAERATEKECAVGRREYRRRREHEPE